jgi:hypothetical protein
MGDKQYRPSLLHDLSRRDYQTGRRLEH